MELRILDRKLAHVGQAAFGAVELLCQPVMFGNHVALFVERWWEREGFAGG
jgi:hypothetical protein